MLDYLPNANVALLFDDGLIFGDYFIIPTQILGTKKYGYVILNERDEPISHNYKTYPSAKAAVDKAILARHYMNVGKLINRTLKSWVASGLITAEEQNAVFENAIDVIAPMIKGE